MEDKPITKQSGGQLGKVAMLWGNIVLAFLVFFLVAHLLDGELSASKFNSTRELAGFIMFPLLSIAGLLLAIWKPLWGGLIVITAMLVNYVLMPELISNVYTGSVVIAGVLYVMSGREKMQSQNKVLKNQSNT